MEMKELALVITAIGGVISVIFSGVAAIYAAKATNRSIENGRDIRVIEKATNSMKDALVKATGDARYLEGKDDERRNPEAVLPVPSSASVIRKDIAAIPEKTADKVVEKLKEN